MSGTGKRRAVRPPSRLLEGAAELSTSSSSDDGERGAGGGAGGAKHGLPQQKAKRARPASHMYVYRYLTSRDITSDLAGETVFVLWPDDGTWYAAVVAKVSRVGGWGRDERKPAPAARRSFSSLNILEKKKKKKKKTERGKPPAGRAGQHGHERGGDGRPGPPQPQARDLLPGSPPARPPPGRQRSRGAGGGGRGGRRRGRAGAGARRRRQQAARVHSRDQRWRAAAVVVALG